MENQGTLDLTEPKTANINIRIQPSLKAVFFDRCYANSTGPLDPADVLRRFMAEYVQKSSQGRLS